MFQLNLMKIYRFTELNNIWKLVVYQSSTNISPLISEKENHEIEELLGEKNSFDVYQTLKKVIFQNYYFNSLNLPKYIIQTIQLHVSFCLSGWSSL